MFQYGKNPITIFLSPLFLVACCLLLVVIFPNGDFSGSAKNYPFAPAAITNPIPKITNPVPAALRQFISKDTPRIPILSLKLASKCFPSSRGQFLYDSAQLRFAACPRGLPAV